MWFSKNKLIFIGLLFHLLAAYFSTGYHQCDELFQVYEFAGYKLGLNSASEMPWEFGAQIRSGMEPWLVYLSVYAMNFVSIRNPFVMALAWRLVMALCTFVVFIKLIRHFEREISDERNKILLWVFSMLFWCIPYFHVRLSSENFSSFLFLAGLMFFLEDKYSYKTNFLVAGFLFGLAFFCRFQVSFMISGFLLWLIFIRKEKWVSWQWLLPGLAMAAACGLLTDKWLYGNWTFTPWNYLSENFFHNQASVFGESPFYFYFAESFIQLIPPFSIFFITGVVLFWFRFPKHVMTWVTLPFILLHFFVAHKELRFLFPVLNFLPAMLLLVFQNIQHSQIPYIGMVLHAFWLRMFFVINLVLLLFCCLRPASEEFRAFEKIYSLPKGNHAVLYFEEKNPYNNLASLHFFRNKKIITREVNSDSTNADENRNVFYFSEKFERRDTLTKNKMLFVKQYSNFPAWFGYLNFNGWLNRAYCFSIYRKL